MEKCRQGRPRSSAFDQNYEFFKVYISEFYSHHLQLPRDFIKNFHGRRPKQVMLKNITGQHWILDMENDKDGTFFKNGWPDFVKDNSLTECEFLVFRYNSRSGLTVRIFGLDGCKKEEEYVKNNGESETEEDDQLTNSKKNLEKRRRKPKEGSRNNVACRSKPITSKSTHLTSREIERALESAKAFTSENPFFIAPIRSPARGKCIVRIPQKFADEYVNKNKEETVNITLTVSGRSWPVKCWCKHGTRIQRGWALFVAANSLQVGDVCVFELVKGTNVCFNVIIIRAGKNFDC